MKTRDRSRRHFIAGMAAVACASACAPLIAAEGGQKTAKDKVGYQETPNNGQKCSDCALYLPDSQQCQVVAGDISPEGWCKLFAPKQ